MQWLKTIKPILTDEQIDRLSNIFDNAGQVVFGIAVVSPIFAGFDKVNLFVVIFGLASAFTCWITSLILIRRKI